MIGLYGTRNKAKHDIKLQHRRITDDYREISWGYRSGGYSNKHCGISIFYRCSHLPPTGIIQTFSPSKNLQGRAGGARWKTKSIDVTLFVLYLPPKPQSAKGWPRYMKVVCEIFGWFSDQLSKLPSRTTPLAVLDLNDQMGDMGAETREEIDEEVVGASFPGPEGFAAKQLRAVLRLHRFCLLNTFENSGPTYWGPRPGTSSRIDFVRAPFEFKNCKKGVQDPAKKRAKITVDAVYAAQAFRPLAFGLNFQF